MTANDNTSADTAKPEPITVNADGSVTVPCPPFNAYELEHVTFTVEQLHNDEASDRRYEAEDATFREQPWYRRDRSALPLVAGDGGCLAEDEDTILPALETALRIEYECARELHVVLTYGHRGLEPVPEEYGDAVRERNERATTGWRAQVAEKRRALTEAQATSRALAESHDRMAKYVPIVSVATEDREQIEREDAAERFYRKLRRRARAALAERAVHRKPPTVEVVS